MRQVLSGNNGQYSKELIFLKYRDIALYQISSRSWLDIVFVLDILDGAYILEIKDHQKLRSGVVVQCGGGSINSFGVLKVSDIIH